MDLMHQINPFRWTLWRQFALLFLLLGGATALRAQVKALMQNGDTVLMYPDGQQYLLPQVGGPRTPGPTRFDPESGQPIPEVLMARKAQPLQSDGRFPANPFPYTKSPQARYMIPHPAGDFQAWFDPDVWLPLPPAEVDPAATAAFSFRGGQALGILVHEPVEVDLKALVDAAYTSTQTVATDVRLGVQEFRDVNGRFVLCVRIDGGQNSQMYTYYSYYYSGQGFTLRYTVYAGRDLFLQQQSSFQQLLNGLIIK